LKQLQRKLSRQAFRSNSWAKTSRRLNRLYARVRRCRQDYLHKVSSSIVRKYSAVVVEDLVIRNMTRSAKGTLEQPGRKVRQKSGLNRSLLDVSPGQFLRMLEYGIAMPAAQMPVERAQF
jgi:putative transposase